MFCWAHTAYVQRGELWWQIKHSHARNSLAWDILIDTHARHLTPDGWVGDDYDDVDEESQARQADGQTGR